LKKVDAGLECQRQKIVVVEYYFGWPSNRFDCVRFYYSLEKQIDQDPWKGRSQVQLHHHYYYYFQQEILLLEKVLNVLD
jgi:hypothetical protein